MISLAAQAVVLDFSVSAALMLCTRDRGAGLVLLTKRRF